MEKIIRLTTVAISSDVHLKGQLSFLNKHFEIIAVSGQDEYLEKVKEREKIQTVAIKMQRNISPFKDLRSLFLLYRLFKKENPQIVHSITPKAGLLSMLAAKFAGVPIRIHTFTGVIFPTKTGLMQKLLIQMDRLLCWAATEIIPEGQGVKNDLEAFNITEKPLHILANGNVNGIDVSYYDPELYSLNDKTALKQELKIGKDDFIFVFVGRIVSEKGINEMVSAFKSISKKNSVCRLLLVGPLEKKLDPLNRVTMNEIESNSQIVLVGFQDDIRPYLAISDALVFPSYREGFPNVVMQAGSMGLPAVVSNINGCNEIIIEKQNGMIIPAKNTEDLYNAMIQILENDELRSKLTLNSRPMIVNRYEQSKVWDALLKKYKLSLQNLN